MNNLRGKTKYLVLLLLVVSAGSCNSGKTVYKQNFDIPHQTWDYDSVIEFSVNIEDTLNWYKIDFTVKHTEEYPFANLWIKSIIIAPDKTYRTDTVNIPFLDQNQRWIGTAIGRTWTLEYPYADSVRFLKKGKYTFLIQHIMRPQQINHIKSFGITIKKSK